MKAIETIEELVEKMKEKGYTKEFIDNFINGYEKFKDPNRKKIRRGNKNSKTNIRNIFIHERIVS